MTEQQALEEAVSALESAAALARAIGVDPATVSMWRLRGRVSVKAAIPIEEATRGRVTRQQLRPDVYPN